MSGLENLINRLNYRGGLNNKIELIEIKVSFKRKALLYSYQAATAILRRW